MKAFRVTFDFGSVEEYTVEEFGPKLAVEARLASKVDIIEKEEKHEADA